MKKPPECASCPYAPKSTGFVPDQFPADPRFAVILKMPGKEELVNGVPMSGKAGRYWEREFLEPIGVKKSDLIIANVIRCYPHGGNFPTGKDRIAACRMCRQWDRIEKEFKPNVVGVTFNPAALMRNPQQTKFLRRALERAAEYARQGLRPLLLMGEEAVEVYAPWLQGALKRWQGSFTEIKEKAA